jgi:hexosaminidase
MILSENHPAEKSFNYRRLLKGLLCITAILLAANINLHAQLHIIPQPVSVTEQKGNFKLKDQSIIAVDAQSMLVGNYLQQYLQNTYQLSLKVKVYDQIPANAAIQLINKATDTVEGAYTMSVSPKTIVITGGGPGLFYGVQSLIQLLPGTVAKTLIVPACQIEDKPRFGWRGLSIDVSRHFFTVDEVKKYIDMMAHYKLDILHWHLTDDEGWRIQIDKYPLLTQVGAKIAYYAKQGKFRKLDNLNDEGRDGFYTKDDIRDVIKYAQDRFITILPEIEMPGHSEAAIFAYPELGCKDSTGAQHRVRMLDPSEYTFTFYENVLTEVMQLFPNQYVHIGGDEAEITDWLKSPTAVALMKKEHFTEPGQVQSYFIKRIEKFLNANGKKLIGWDEILKGGLAPSATVMSWEGEEGGIIAAKMHHKVVMTPLPQMYFDAPQANALTEPIGWNDPVSWQMVYNYEPQSKQLTPDEAKYILGAQANIWVEKIGTYKHLEYMIYPRLLAVAELTWTPKADKDINRFEQSMYANYRLFNLWNLNARIPNADGLKDVITNKDNYSQTITYPLKDAQVRYSFNTKTDTNATAGTFPLTLNSALKDTLSIRLYITRSPAKPVTQIAFIKHVNVPSPMADAPNLQPGLGYFAYRTTYNNYPTLDTAKTFMTGVLQQGEFIKPFPGQFNTWVKLNGYLKIDTEGDYRITSDFENSPLILLNNLVIISGNKNKYIEPEETILHLQKGVYAISGYYLADATNSEQTLISIKPADGKPLETAGYLFH